MREENNEPTTPPRSSTLVRTTQTPPELRLNNSETVTASQVLPNTTNISSRPHGTRRRRVDTHRNRRSTAVRSDPLSAYNSSSSSMRTSQGAQSTPSNAILLAVLRDLQSLGSGGQAINEHVIRYIYALRLKGLQLQAMGGDGNCLFRSVAHQVYGTESLHRVCRQAAADYMEAEADFFADFVSENGNEGSHGASGAGGFAMYLSDIRKDGVWGDDPEVQALCEIYNRPAEIWAYDPVNGAKLLRVFHSAATTSLATTLSTTSSTTTTTTTTTTTEALGRASVGSGITNTSIDNNLSSRVDVSSIRPPIRLSYFAGGHYDSVKVSDADLWRAQLTSPDMAGVKEEQALRSARSRAAFRLSSSSSSTSSLTRTPDQHQVIINSTINMSDLEATENSTVQAALAASRAQWEASQDDDLDAALLESLSHASSNPSSSTGIGLTTTSAAIKSIIDDDENGDLARALQTSQAELEGSMQHDFESAQRESLLTAQASRGGSITTVDMDETSRLWAAAASLTEDEQTQCLLSGMSPEQFIAARDKNLTTFSAWGGSSGGNGGVNTTEDDELALALLLSSQQHNTNTPKR